MLPKRNRNNKMVFVGSYLSQKGEYLYPTNLQPPAMQYLLFLALLLFSTSTSAQRLYDSAGHLTGRTDGDRFFDAAGRFIGRNDKNRIYDGSGRQIGRIEGTRVYDAAGKSVGRVDGERLYDGSGRLTGRIACNRLYDGSGRQIARSEDLQQYQLVVFFYFFM